MAAAKKNSKLSEPSSRKREVVNNEQLVSSWTPTTTTPSPVMPRAAMNVKPGLIVAATLAVVLLAAVAFWAKTKTWPVVAMIGNTPITRYEVDQALFTQYGVSTIEGLVTQKQIEAELKRQNVQVEASAVDARINEIKTSLGPNANFDQELQSRGLDATKLRNLIELQLKLNKVVEGKATVSAEEIDTYVKTNDKFLSGKTPEEKRKEAEDLLKQDKLNAAIDAWVNEAKKKVNVWRLFPEPTQPAGQSAVQQ